MVKRKVRLSQTLTPFGVGAIYDFLGESLVACDTYRWANHGVRLRPAGLDRALGVKELRRAPTVTYGSHQASVPFYRFPQWLFCPRCRRMTRWSTRMEEKGEQATCSVCGKGGGRPPQLVPMRFILVCEDGHMSDIPWHRWAHSKPRNDKQRQCQQKDLRFISLGGVGGGLESMEVRCHSCGAAESLAGITTAKSFEGLHVRCSGKQPWEPSDRSQPCSKTPQPLQRGASNVYFARIESAIEIPPESDYSFDEELALRIKNTDEYRAVHSNPTAGFAKDLVAIIAVKCSCSKEVVMEVVRAEIASEAGRPTRPSTEEDRQGDLQRLTAGEWKALISPRLVPDDRSRFVTEHVGVVPQDLPDVAAQELAAVTSLVDKVVLVTKLREVRALVGFRRYSPDTTMVRPDLGRGLDWLPAIEVFGEGVFLSLKEDRVAMWEVRPEVRREAERLETRRSQALMGERLPKATPRFVLLHTLAHLVMRQLAFDCGYSSASLRERIYAKEPGSGSPQLGLLIYTAAGDVEGTLGGLCRNGQPPRMASTVLAALEAAAWCSNDPICLESNGQGFDSMNLAACHACALAPETSCVYGNALLDRKLVLGSPQFLHGFFADALEAAVQVRMEAATG